MGRERPPLQSELIRDVDTVGELDLGLAEVVRGRRDLDPVGCLFGHGHSLFCHGGLDLGTVHRRLQHAGHTGHLGGPVTDAVHLNVIGVAVAAVVVVHGEYVGLLLGEDRCQTPRRLVHIGLPEGIREVIGRLAHHPRVDVPEELHTIHPEHLRSSEGLGDPSLPERLALLEDPWLGFTPFATGRHHQHHTSTGRRGLGHQPTGGNGFVVGVGMETDQCVHGRRIQARAGAPVQIDTPIDAVGPAAEGAGPERQGPVGCWAVGLPGPIRAGTSSHRLRTPRPAHSKNGGGGTAGRAGHRAPRPAGSIRAARRSPRISSRAHAAPQLR